MFGLKRIALPAVVAAAMLACNDQPTAPVADLDVDMIALDDYGFVAGRGSALGCSSGPGTCFGATTNSNRSYLGTLVQQAYQTLSAEQGQVAADAAFAELWQLHEAAFALRAEDRAAFIAAMQAVHTESARLVIAVLGPETATTVLQLAAAKLAELQNLIAQNQAAGLDTSRLEFLAARVSAFLDSAQDSLAAGDAVGALDLASRALQAATVGGGQLAGGRGGKQYRGGR